MVCPACWRQNPNDASHCAHCGKTLLPDAERRYELLGATVADDDLALEIVGRDTVRQTCVDPETPGQTGIGQDTIRQTRQDLDTYSQTLVEPEIAHQTWVEPRSGVTNTPSTTPNTSAAELLNTAAPTQQITAEPKQQTAQPDATDKKAADLARPPAKRLARVLIILGAVVLACAFAWPWLVTGQLSLHAGCIARFSQLYLVGAAAALLLAGVLPLPYAIRAVVCVLLGLVPLSVAVAGRPFDWRQLLALSMFIMLPTFLLHRARRDHSSSARIAMLVGVCALMATLLVPRNGTIPGIELFIALDWHQPPLHTALRLLPALLYVLSVLALVALIGQRPAFLARFCAIGFLCYLPIQIWLSAAVASPTVQQTFAARLGAMMQGGVTLTYLVITAMGMSQIAWTLSKSAHPLSPEDSSPPHTATA